jgi:SAM-dependent methyltransferase
MTTTTAAKPFDPVKYKETTREQWQSAAQAWNDWGPLLRAWLGPATEIMLDMAAIEPGHRVLDVAAGAGDQTLQTATRVGPSGRVLATDISPNILAFAEASARNAGLGNVETRVLDGEELDVPEGAFDAVISRVGLIYFPDQQKALAGMKRALKPGGRVAAIVYSTAENNKFFSIPVSIIRRRANLPPPLPGQPGPFSLGGPGVLEESFRKAGFRDVRSRTIPAPVRTQTAAECVRFEKESFGALHQMLAGLDEAGREAAWDEIEHELGAFEGKAGFEGPCEMVVAVGVK